MGELLCGVRCMMRHLSKEFQLSFAAVLSLPPTYSSFAPDMLFHWCRSNRELFSEMLTSALKQATQSHTPGATPGTCFHILGNVLVLGARTSAIAREPAVNAAVREMLLLDPSYPQMFKGLDESLGSFADEMETSDSQ